MGMNSSRRNAWTVRLKMISSTASAWAPNVTKESQKTVRPVFDMAARLFCSDDGSEAEALTEPTTDGEPDNDTI